MPKEARMKYCGIDLHLSNSVIMITGATDKVIVSRRCPNGLKVTGST